MNIVDRRIKDIKNFQNKFDNLCEVSILGLRKFQEDNENYQGEGADQLAGVIGIAVALITEVLTAKQVFDKPSDMLAFIITKCHDLLDDTLEQERKMKQEERNV